MKYSDRRESTVIILLAICYSACHGMLVGLFQGQDGVSELCSEVRGNRHGRRILRDDNDTEEY
jgi:hypothetical protein